MPPGLLILLLPLAATLLSGCTSTQHHVFHGRVENLPGQARMEQGIHPAPVLRLERNPASHTYMAIQLSPESAVIISFVEPVSNTPVVIRSPGMKGWLTSLPLPKEPLQDQIRFPSFRPLHGPMKLNWKSPGIFNLSMNLRSEDEPPAIIRGKVKTERDWNLHH